MILNKKPLMLSEVKEYVTDSEESKVMIDYLKSYCKLTKEKGAELHKEITGLNNPKIKEEHVVKIADLLPKDAEDLNKIFMDVILTEEETNTLLAIIKKY